MNPKLISDAQLEIWSCKDKLYQEVKEMNLADALAYLVKKGEKEAKELREAKKTDQAISAK